MNKKLLGYVAAGALALGAFTGAAGLWGSKV